MTKKVVFCVPSLNGPTKHFINALEASMPLITAAGWEDGAVECRGNPYISYARAEMLRKAMDAKADVVVFIDYDLSWNPQDLLTLIETPGDVVAGTYRYKKDEEEYMGAWNVDSDNRAITRSDGCISATRIPAGFLKITKNLVDRYMAAYPNLIFGPYYNASLDLFNHGVIERTWYGEDMAFSKRWVDVGGEIWLVPTLNLTHHQGDKAYPGNLHEFLLEQPGGSNDPNR